MYVSFVSIPSEEMGSKIQHVQSVGMEGEKDSDRWYP